MSRIKAFSLGVSELWRGFRFFGNNKGLWLYAVIPTVLNLAILTLSIILMVNHFGGIYDQIISWMGLSELREASGFFGHILFGLIWAARELVKGLLFLILAMLALLATYFVAQILVSPFNDALSEKAEEIITGIPAPPFSLTLILKNTWRIVKTETIKAFFFIGVPMALIFLNFIPVIGSIFYTILTVCFGAWSLGFTYVDYPMGRRYWGFRRRIAFTRKNLLATMGFGVVFIIPFFAFVFTAPMTVAGTSLFLKLKDDEVKVI